MTLRDLYVKTIGLNKKLMELTIAAMNDPSGDAPRQRDATMQELTTATAALTAAEQSVSPDELTAIQAKLRQEGVLPQ
jgi:hypothetical protein